MASPKGKDSAAEADNAPSKPSSSSWFQWNRASSKADQSSTSQDENNPFQWDLLPWQGHVMLAERVIGTKVSRDSGGGTTEDETAVANWADVITYAGQSAAPRGRFSVPSFTKPKEESPEEGVLLQALVNLTSHCLQGKAAAAAPAAEQPPFIQALVPLLSHPGSPQVKVFSAVLLATLLRRRGSLAHHAMGAVPFLTAGLRKETRPPPSEEPSPTEPPVSSSSSGGGDGGGGDWCSACSLCCSTLWCTTEAMRAALSKGDRLVTGLRQALTEASALAAGEGAEGGGAAPLSGLVCSHAAAVMTHRHAGKVPRRLAMGLLGSLLDLLEASVQGRQQHRGGVEPPTTDGTHSLREEAR